MRREPEEALVSPANVDIYNAIRAAVAHERAALGHEDKYEQQMKAAGANMYAAFAGALRLTDEYQGRKLDEQAVLRIYRGTKPRRWWDEQLIAAKGGDRDYAQRLIQWHIDIEGARERRAKHAVACSAFDKRVAKQRTNAAHGSGQTRESAPAAPSTESMRSLSATGAERDEATPPVTLEDLLGEVSRLQVAAKKVEADHRADALAAVRNAARELERYIP